MEIDSLCQLLEKKRHKAVFLFVLDVVLSSIVGVSGFALIIAGAIMEAPYQAIFLPIGFALFLILMPLFVFLAIRASSSYKKSFFETLVPFFSKGSYKSLSYSFKKDGGQIKKMSSSSRLPRFDEDEASFYEGSFDDGTSFFSFFYAKTVMGKGHPDPCYCRYVELTLTKELPYEISIAPRNAAVVQPHKLPEEIRSESILFERRYEATSSSKNEGYVFLSPSLIDFISHYEEGLFYLEAKDSHIFIRLEGFGSYFPCRLSKRVTPETVSPLERECSLFKRIYDALPSSITR